MGWPPWRTRFGIHVGSAQLHGIAMSGSSDRIDYTAVGDNVNIAARLGGPEQVLREQYPRERTDRDRLFRTNSPVRRVDRSQPKGVGHPLDIFRTARHDRFRRIRFAPGMTKLVQDWDKVYEAYGSRDWMRVSALGVCRRAS